MKKEKKKPAPKSAVKTELRKTGRPKYIIDWDKVDDLIVAGCNGTQIASYLGINHDVFYRKCMDEHKLAFSAYLLQKRPKGEALILLAQFDEAIRNRDRGMLIWLGKNRCGQSDKSEVEHKGQVPVEVVNYSTTQKTIQPWKEEVAKAARAK